jgi:hypothetical protein
MLRQSVGVLLCILTLVSANTLAAEKIALVIGNGDYEHVTKLKNPPKDVRNENGSQEIQERAQ